MEMKPKLNSIMLLIILFAFQINMAIGDVTQQDIARAIRSDLQHPYLYFTDADKPAILDRIQKNPDCHDIMQKLLAEANRYMYTPVDPVPPPRTPHPRYNRKYDYEQYFTDNSIAAQKLALVYQLTGEEKYARKAFEFIDVVCDMPTWVHSAHDFDVIYDRVWPWGVEDDQVVFSYQQRTDHLVLDVASVYDWLYPALTRRQRDRIRGALLEKAITRVRGNYEYHWWAAAYRCNWCGSLNSSLGVAAIVLLTEDPQLTDVIAESYNRINKVHDEIGDGGWAEGAGYFIATIRLDQFFMDALINVTNGRFNMYEHPLLKNVSKTSVYCQIPPDRSVHFGDAGGGAIWSYGWYYYMFNRLMLETGDRQAAWCRKHLAGGRPVDFYDLFYPASALEPELTDETSMHFRSVDWIILRSDFIDSENVVIAGKSGANDDPHHGHLDVGHFSLYWRGEEFLCDHGSAGYDRAYFDEKRWEYPLASTIGHNTVMVNGEEQLSCKYKNKPWNLSYGGRVVEFRPGKTRDYALLDPSNAYPKQEMKSWRRHITLDKPVVTVVLDEVSCATGAEIEVRFHSPNNQVEQVVGDGYVMLNSEKGKMALIPIVAGDVTLRPGTHRILMAVRDASFRYAPYVGTVKKAQQERTVIGTIILPVDDESEAKKITKSVSITEDSSGNLKLSFRIAGKSFTYRYKQGPNGLVLE